MAKYITFENDDFMIVPDKHDFAKGFDRPTSSGSVEFETVRFTYEDLKYSALCSGGRPMDQKIIERGLNNYRTRW